MQVKLFIGNDNIGPTQEKINEWLAQNPNIKIENVVAGNWGQNSVFIEKRIQIYIIIFYSIKPTKTASS